MKRSKKFIFDIIILFSLYIWAIKLNIFIIQIAPNLEL